MKMGNNKIDIDEIFKKEDESYKEIRFRDEELESMASAVLRRSRTEKAREAENIQVGFGTKLRRLFIGYSPDGRIGLGYKISYGSTAVILVALSFFLFTDIFDSNKDLSYKNQTIAANNTNIVPEKDLNSNGLIIEENNQEKQEKNQINSVPESTRTIQTIGEIATTYQSRAFVEQKKKSEAELNLIAMNSVEKILKNSDIEFSRKENSQITTEWLYENKKNEKSRLIFKNNPKKQNSIVVKVEKINEVQNKKLKTKIVSYKELIKQMEEEIFEKFYE